MKVLLWLMIPVAALIVGIIWASLRSRPPRPAAMQDSMASFSRFRRALATDSAGSPTRRPRPVSGALARGPVGADEHAELPAQGDLDEPAGRGTRAE
jgi:hypothetical protein